MNKPALMHQMESMDISTRDLRTLFRQEVPSGYVNSWLLNMVIEIVDLPIKNGDFQ